MQNIQKVIKNNEYIVEIIDNGMEFEGVAKIGDMVVFVPGTIASEKVKIQIIKVTSSYAIGKVLEVLDKDINRVEPPCASYKRCGGCSALHMEYEKTLNIKYKNVVNTIAKAGINTDVVENIYGMGVPYNYRNKVQYPVRQHKGITKMGMYAKNTHDVIENANGCLIQNEDIDKVAKKLFETLVCYGFVGFDESQNAGDIKHIMVRCGIHTGQIMCTVVVKDKDIVKDKRLDKVIEEMVSFNENITSIILNINPQNTNVILGNENICVFGKDYIDECLGDFTFKISASSFFQVNTIQAEALYNVLKEKMNLQGDKTLLELYSGVGSIGIFLSPCVKEVVGVEIVKEAVKMAKDNVARNEICNASYICEDATKAIYQMEKDGKHFDYIVVDPPRKGLDLEGIELILNSNAEKIGYVSCNVATLARDLKLLESKYRVESINMVDMFPFTPHVECCSVLKLKESTEI